MPSGVKLVVTVTKLRHMSPPTIEHRSEPDKGQMWHLKSGHESETNSAGHRVRQGALVQFSASLMDIEFEKPHLASVLKHRVQFSFQMSTRCPLDTKVRIWVVRR